MPILASNIIITQKQVIIGQNVVYDAVVHYEGKSLHCDCGNLPRSLSILAPLAWGNKPAKAWIPFVERAIVLGLL